MNTAHIEIADLAGHELSFFVDTDAGREYRTVTLEDHDCDSPTFAWEGPTKWESNICGDGTIAEYPDQVRCEKCRKVFMVG
mgnify:CR=1 FL=1